MIDYKLSIQVEYDVNMQVQIVSITPSSMGREGETIVLIGSQIASFEDITTALIQGAGTKLGIIPKPIYYHSDFNEALKERKKELLDLFQGKSIEVNFKSDPSKTMRFGFQDKPEDEP